MHLLPKTSKISLLCTHIPPYVWNWVRGCLKIGKNFYLAFQVWRHTHRCINRIKKFNNENNLTHCTAYKCLNIQEYASIVATVHEIVNLTPRHITSCLLQKKCPKDKCHSIFGIAKWYTILPPPPPANQSAVVVDLGRIRAWLIYWCQGSYIPIQGLMSRSESLCNTPQQYHNTLN